jgi:hypothetical protein
MSRLLKPEYFKAVEDDELGLFRKVGAALGLKPTALLKAMSRTPDRLAHYDSVMVIAEAFKKKPDDILTFEKAKVCEEEEREYSTNNSY